MLRRRLSAAHEACTFPTLLVGLNQEPTLSGEGW